VANVNSGSLEPVATHNYGRITVGFTGQLPVGVSPEQIDHVADLIAKRLRDDVVPAVEQIVEEDGVRIVGDSVHTRSELSLLDGGGFSAQVDCELVSDVSESAMVEVDHIIQDELKPIRGYFSRMRRSSWAQDSRDEEADRRNFIRAVRSVMGGMRGRGD
jgi:hypothetical protein